MSRNRTRSRSQTSASRSLGRKVGTGLVILALVVLLLNLGAVGAFTTSVADRVSKVGVASNSNALLGLDVASSVESGDKDRLVTLTNNLEETTTVTVTLDDKSLGTLHVGSTSTTDGSITIDIPAGSSAEVYLTVGSGSSDQTCSSRSDRNTGAVPGFDVVYYCHVYDSASDETTYAYKVLADGNSDEEDEEDDGDGNGGGPPGKKGGGSDEKDVSHTVFGVPADSFSDDDVVSMHPSWYAERKIDKADPTTGVAGVKFDQELDTDDGCQIYHYTLDGRHGEGTVDIGVKAGPNDYTFQLTGPSASSSSGGSSKADTVTFSVTATAPSSTIQVKTLQSSITSSESSKSIANVPACTSGDDEDD